MKDVDKDLKMLFSEIREEHAYDYEMEDAIVDIINLPKDYNEELSRARLKRRWSIISTCILLPIYLWLLMAYTPGGNEPKVTLLASSIILAVIGVFFSAINTKIKIT